MQIQCKCVLRFKHMMSVICQKECVSLPMCLTGHVCSRQFLLSETLYLFVMGLISVTWASEANTGRSVTITTYIPIISSKTISSESDLQIQMAPTLEQEKAIQLP